MKANYIDELASSMVKKTDGILRMAVTEKLGEGWTLESLRGRLVVEKYPDGVDVFCLDGTELVEFHPLRFEQVVADCSVKVKVSQNYIVLVRDGHRVQVNDINSQ